MSIKINHSGIRIRPSSVDGFFNCRLQWAKVFLEGMTSIPGARAAIGTGIHKGAEVFWNEVMVTKDKAVPIDVLTDAAIETFHEEAKAGLQYDDGENSSTAEKTIIQGVSTFVSDIAEFAPIPTGVEMFVKVKIDHPLVEEIGGTIDYYNQSHKVIADLKTSKRKPTPANYVTQQSIYKYLAEANNLPVDYNQIQGVILKASPEGLILPLEPEVDQAKYLVNHMLDVLEVAVQDKAPLEILFPGNPKYYLCSEKYCANYKKCKFANGEVQNKKVSL